LLLGRRTSRPLAEPLSPSLVLQKIAAAPGDGAPWRSEFSGCSGLGAGLELSRWQRGDYAIKHFKVDVRAGTVFLEEASMFLRHRVKLGAFYPTAGDSL
jgi:hypothetical protein